jgi:hypothetical protein
MRQLLRAVNQDNQIDEELSRKAVEFLLYFFLLLGTIGCGFRISEPNPVSADTQLRKPKVFLTRISTHFGVGQKVLTKWNVEIHVPGSGVMDSSPSLYAKQSVLEINSVPGVEIVSASPFARSESSIINLQFGNLASGSIVRGEITLASQARGIPPLKSRLLFRQGQQKYLVHVAERTNLRTGAFEGSTFFESWKNRLQRQTLGERLDYWLSERRKAKGYGFVY